MTEPMELDAERVDMPTDGELYLWVTRYSDTAHLSGVAYDDWARAHDYVPAPFDDKPIHRGLFKIRIPFDALEKVDPHVG